MITTRRVSWSIPLLVAGVFGALSTLATIGDPDLFWHLAQGRQTLAEGLVRVDRFSWSVAGLPVLTDQWLGQVLWYAAYALAGWHGIVLQRALLVGAVTMLVVVSAHAAQPRAIGAVVAALPAIALTRFAWTERPQLMALACFALLLFILRAAEARPRVLLGLPPLLLVWANLHASFPLGLALVALVCGEMAWRRRELRGLAMSAIVVSFGATLLTPTGVGIWTQSGGHFLSPPRLVQEEGVPDVTQPYGVVFVFVVAAVLVTALLARPVALRDVLVLVPVLFVSMTAARHTPFFAVAAAPYLAARAPEAIAAIGARLRVSPRLPRLSDAVPSRRVDAVSALLALAIIVAAAFVARGEPSLDPYPADALAALPRGPGLLNDYDWGGFLIWYAPDTPVFVDGRLFPFTGAALRDYQTMVDLGPAWRETLAKRGVRAVLIKPTSPLAVRARDLRWPVLSESSRYVLFTVPESQ
jgi:hypothetical protein